jgi:Kef-type K+ transport system membrane component KefB
VRKLRSSVFLSALTVVALFLLLPGVAHARGEGDGSVASLLLILAVMLVAAKVLGDLAERIGQPAVLGELLAGVLLGGSALGLIPTVGGQAEFIATLAELGVILLLFEIGLETDLKEMFRVGRSSLAVAFVGVVLPFALGVVFWRMLPGEFSTHSATAIFIGATLTATSVGITARVLSDLRQLHTDEAKIIIGAAVIDDVLGLVMLSVVSGLGAGAAVSVLGVSTTLAIAAGFLVVAIVTGKFVAPRLFDVVDRMRVRHVLVVFAVAFALALAAVADMAGSAMIIGAFAAGLILSETNQFDVIEEGIRPVAGVFTPIFFVAVGSSVDLSLVNPMQPESRLVLGVAGGLTVLAVVGKLVAGWAAPWRRFRRLAVGIGMVPRGEVGLIFADIGRRSGVVNEAAFSAVVIMVMATTFLAPVGLKMLLGRGEDPGEADTEAGP